MKTCPFCAEEIQEAALKCKHCGEFIIASRLGRLNEEEIKWYYKKSFIITAFCVAGPLALPLIVSHPQLSKAWKIGLTIGILVLSFIFLRIMVNSIFSLSDYYSILDEM